MEEKGGRRREVEQENYYHRYSKKKRKKKKGNLQFAARNKGEGRRERSPRGVACRDWDAFAATRHRSRQTVMRSNARPPQRNAREVGQIKELISLIERRVSRASAPGIPHSWGVRHSWIFLCIVLKINDRTTEERRKLGEGRGGVEIAFEGENK